MSKRDYPDYPPQRIRKHRLVVGDATFIVSSNVDDNKRWIREVHHVRRHRKGGSAEVSIYPNGGRKPSAALASLWAHLGIDPDARWKECAADHPAFPAKRSIRTAMDAVDDARKNAAAAAVLAASGWTWADGGAGHWEAPPAQAVDLQQMPQGVRLIEIPRRNNLDPINVFVQDYELGRGRIVVTCYGQAWCGFWGAMGERTVMQFVAACDADYVAGNMLSGRHEHVKKHERAYVERIATEVIAEFRALIDSQAVGNG